MKLLVGATRVHAALGAGRVVATSPVAPWEGDAAGEFREHFLDETFISSLVGAARGVNIPTKDPVNPLDAPAGANTGTFDYQKLYVSAHHDGSLWHFHYGAADDTGDAARADTGHYATSVDGVTITKPNLGLFEWEESTDNNITIDGRLTSCRYYDDLELWVATVERRAGFTARMWIYTSGDPDAGWTLDNTIDPGSASEGKDLLRLEDGRWLAYFSTGHSIDRRRIIAWRSATSDLDSVFTTVGTVVEGPSTSDQRYSMGVERIGDIHYHIVQRYNSTTERTYADLYTSRDGLHLSLVTQNFIGLGTSGAFDDEMIFGANRIVEVDDTWFTYYVGSAVTHDTPRPKDMRLARVSIPKGRIGEVSGTGTVTTVPLTPTVGQVLSLNCDGSGGGKIEVAVLDEHGAPLPGFAHTDCTDITTDTFAVTPSWGGSSMPVGDPIQLRFHLTAATLYGYEIR